MTSRKPRHVSRIFIYSLLTTVISQCFLASAGAAANEHLQSTGESNNVKQSNDYMDRVMTSLRENWDMPAEYLEQRGYLSKRSPLDAKTSVLRELSPQAQNLLNGPLLNPLTNSYIFGRPVSQYLPPEKIVLHSRDAMELTTAEEALIGEGLVQKIKDKWRKLFDKKNDTTFVENSTVVSVIGSTPIQSQNLTESPVIVTESPVNGSSSIDKRAGSNNHYPDVLTNMSKSDLQYLRYYVQCLKHQNDGPSNLGVELHDHNVSLNHDVKLCNATKNETDLTGKSFIN